MSAHIYVCEYVSRRLGRKDEKEGRRGREGREEIIGGPRRKHSSQ